MTRHPKKKGRESKPDSTNPNVKDLPPEEPVANQVEGIKVKNPLDKLFWIRVGLGVLAGIIAAQTGGSVDVSTIPYLGFGIMIIIFIISYGIAKAMHIPLPPSDRKKLVMTGIGSYFFMFIFTWILVNTLMHPSVIGLNLVK